MKKILRDIIKNENDLLRATNFISIIAILFFLSFFFFFFFNYFLKYIKSNIERKLQDGLLER